jgi:hypothetical protein
MYEYLKEDISVEYFVSDDLGHKISIELPSLQEWMSKWYGREMTYEEALKCVEGYGKKPEDQYFVHAEIPEKLRMIEGVVRKKLQMKPKELVRLEEINAELLDNQKFYESEIYFIKREIRRSYLGYWFMNNGKPTYITGQNYHYLNWWNADNAKRDDRRAEYRDRDRRWYHFVKYCQTTCDGWFKYMVTYTDGVETITKFCNTDSAISECRKNAVGGNILVNDNGGEGWIKDMEKRTCYGVIYPKHRREGATTRATHGLWYGAAFSRILGKAGIQSITGPDHAKPVFDDHVRKKIRRLPFFFQLMTTGASAEAIHFGEPINKAANSVVGSDSILPHDGWINYKASGERAYDGEKMHAVLHDEIGKMGTETGVDVYVRYEVVKKTLAQGSDIHGVIYCTSTLGEMVSGGGNIMRRMVIDSLFRNRDDNGMTVSGMLALFFPAWDCYDGFIDKYGMSIVEVHKSYVLNNSGDKVYVGSKQWLENGRLAKLMAGDESKYISLVQDFPFTLKECFLSASKGSTFPIKRITERLTELRFDSLQTRKYRLDWVNGVKFGYVRAVPDDNGLHIFSHLPLPAMQNLKEFMEDGSFGPDITTRNKYVIGIDPMRFESEEVEGKKKSYHCAVGYRLYDPFIDFDGVENRVTERFFYSFKDRMLTIDEQDEEMAKVLILLGCMAYPENNEPHTYRNLIKWGLGNYLIWNVDDSGVRAKKPGGTATDGNVGSTKQVLYQRMEEHLKKNVDREVHEEILEDCLEIESLKDMTKHDLFAAAGWALMGTTSNYVNFVQEMEKQNFIEELPFKEYLE